jgi:hypothetical protein
MKKGMAFLDVEVPTRNGPARHLNVIITEPDDEGNCLAVPICSYRETNGRPFPNQDESYLLSPGCHPFIKKKSYALYRKAKAISSQTLSNGLKRKVFSPQPDMAIEVVQGLQCGAELSRFFPEELKRFFNYFISP